MGDILSEILDANAKFSSTFGERHQLSAIPSRHFAILTCMDARLDPDKIAGLGEGDAHVIRNAGARASDDAIRSLIISYKLMGTKEWFVIHHTKCGMATFTEEKIRDLLRSSLETAVLTPEGWVDVGEGPGSADGDYMSFLPLKPLPNTLLQDVARIRNHPLVPKRIPIYGCVYDVETGVLTVVEEACKIGAAS